MLIILDWACYLQQRDNKYKDTILFILPGVSADINAGYI